MIENPKSTKQRYILYFCSMLSLLSMNLYAKESMKIHNKGPAYSPDGKKIIFFSNKDLNNELWVMNADGSNPKKLTEGYNNDRWPSFSGNGKKILFMSPKEDGDWDLYTINSDGTERKKITFNNTADLGGSYSPDGKQIAVSTVREDGSYADVYIISIDGQYKKQLINNAYWPKWNHKGNTITFGRNPGIEGKWDIWSYNVNSSTERVLVNDKGRNVGGALSPDGQTLIFGSNRDGDYSIFTKNMKTGEIKSLDIEISFDGAPSYSHDGKRLLYVNSSDTGQTIYELDLHTREVRAIHPQFD